MQKLIGVATFDKRFVLCERAEACHEDPKCDDCRWSWTGSAKSMESAGAVNISAGISV